MPALIERAGKEASLRFLEFFTVNIRNPNTRAAYGRAAGAFLQWCEDHGIAELCKLQPVHVAAYIEQLGRERSAPTVKQHLACLRMLFEVLVQTRWHPGTAVIMAWNGGGRGPLQRAAFRPAGHHPLCQVVPQLQTECTRFGRNDGRAWN